MEKLWPVITVVGPILLGLILIWAIMKNRRKPVARSEQGAHDLYDSEYKKDRRAEAEGGTPGV